MRQEIVPRPAETNAWIDMLRRAEVAPANREGAPAPMTAKRRWRPESLLRSMLRGRCEPSVIRSWKFAARRKRGTSRCSRLQPPAERIAGRLRRRGETMDSQAFSSDAAGPLAWPSAPHQKYFAITLRMRKLYSSLAALHTHPHAAVASECAQFRAEWGVARSRRAR